MRTIKASELGSFLYCRRAWFYAQQGEASENTTALTVGSSRHAGHARKVKAAIALKWFSLILLLTGLVLILWK